MAGQQFQYDDSGNTFFYFLTSFVGLIVIPATYYLWPRDQHAGEGLRGGLCEALTPLLGSEGGGGPCIPLSWLCFFIIFFFPPLCFKRLPQLGFRRLLGTKGAPNKEIPFHCFLGRGV